MSTIASISTAPGIGGIGIIRMSGKDCFEILNKIFKPKNMQKIDEIKGLSYHPLMKMIKGSNIIGLPQCFSGKESVCQCRRHRLDP